MKGWRHLRQPRGTKYWSAFSGTQNTALHFHIPSSHFSGGFRHFWPPAQGRDGHLLGQDLGCGRTCFQHGRSSLSCCPRAPDVRLSVLFVLSHLPLTLFFFSWSFLPLVSPLSLTYPSAHFILRAQPGAESLLRVSCQSIKCTFSVCSSADCA